MPPKLSNPNIEIIVVAENASAKFGGEAILPLHYFTRLHARGMSVKLIVHERVRAELAEIYPKLLPDIEFIPDSRVQIFMDRLSQNWPMRVREYFFMTLISFITAIRQRRAVKRLIASGFGDVVHQPTPVSPRTPSFMFGLEKPLIVGPMNGDIDFPSGFAYLASRQEQTILRIGRQIAGVANFFIRGKRQAQLLLAANKRSLDALPQNTSGRRELLFENGVDLDLWQRKVDQDSPPQTPAAEFLTFVYIGRLVDWKAVDILISTLPRLPKRVQLKIIGDGEERPALEALAEELGVAERVKFMGFLPQQACVSHLMDATALVLSSVRECGGAVVLEAMACAKPVIVTKWGGPVDYVDENCGFLISPESKETMILGFASAMEKLANDPELASSMGVNARLKVEEKFDWEKKIDAMIAHYESVTQPKFGVNAYSSKANRN